MTVWFQLGGAGSALRGKPRAGDEGGAGTEQGGYCAVLWLPSRFAAAES